ncbi:hypothetical protein FA95DRAFT_1559224 [Auriscalpium vulgare]|uniref:Uncharacterized protein n=1 Tax=Auriscalpium vulgare TaxID=40419 RepID=A0ACB8RTR2_9AGAM|nr:hypothetical protein FA95DRAFT_1559224 [Auriscalpium vulgare]
MADVEKGGLAHPPIASNASLRDVYATGEYDMEAADIAGELPFPSPMAVDLADAHSLRPPSFAQSEFQTIVRRQRRDGNDPEGLKSRRTRRRAPQVEDSQWDFAGWGTMRYLEISPEEVRNAEARIGEPQTMLGVLAASSVAGNGLSGSVFYAFPLVAAAAGIYSPLCLFVASLLLLFFRPVMLELAATVRINGANYVYLLQFAGKTASIVGAAATLLDAVATSTVSAATASTYLAGEINTLPFSAGVLTILFLVALSLVALAGIKESASVTAVVFVFHLTTMFGLALASIVHWAHADPHSTVLKGNWSLRPDTALETVRAIFYGICIAFLGVTGFECTPSYIEHMRPKTYSTVLRNLIAIATVLNATLSLLVFAVLPAATIASGANVLSALATRAAGRWLRIIVVVDAVSVLLGGVMTGVVTASRLFDRLARDRVLPQFFLWELPITKSPYIATLTSVGLSLLLYVASGMSLSTVSSMFSVAFLSVLFLYALSDLLLKLNRPRLSRAPHSGLLVLAGAFVVVITTLAGNIALQPSALAVFAASFAIVLSALVVLNAQPHILRLLLRTYSVSPLARLHATRGWQAALVGLYRRVRSARMCVWIKDDDIHTMLQALLSVQRNAPDARTVVFVHAYPSVDRIPSELHPNTRLLDEAFPTITIDLAFVQGAFSPALVEAASRALDVPRSRMCVLSLSRDHPWEIADYGGVRVIM